MSAEQGDTEIDIPVQIQVTPAVEEPLIVVQESSAGSLSQFTYSIRHRIIRPFPNGAFEGRLRLAAGEYIVSATTMDDVIAAMTLKADSLIANGYKVQA